MLHLYMDQHVQKAITDALRLRGVDVLTAFEDDAHEFPDPLLLTRASELERVLFTWDDDFLTETTRRLNEGIPFYSVVYAHQLRMTIKQCVDDLEMIVKTSDAEDVRNQAIFLPI